MNGETGFSNTAWARDGDQAHILSQQEFFGGSYFLLAPDEPSLLHRNIGRPSVRLLKRLFREAIAYRCKFVGEISSGGVAFIGLFCETPLNGPTQRSGGVWYLHSDRLRVLLENGYHRFRCRASSKGTFAGDHLVEHQAERELV